MLIVGDIRTFPKAHKKGLIRNGQALFLDTRFIVLYGGLNKRRFIMAEGLLIAALVLFILGTFNVGAPRFNLVSAGLACFVGSALLGLHGIH
jgi:hypothetical protein